MSVSSLTGPLDAPLLARGTDGSPKRTRGGLDEDDADELSRREVIDGVVCGHASDGHAFLDPEGCGRGHGVVVGASGKKLTGRGQRRKANSPPAQVKDGGFGLPPHPLQVRSGQRYVARAGNHTRPFQIGRVDRAAGRVSARRLDGARERVTLVATRLLLTRPDGQGRHYQFAGFDSRRYTTSAVVMQLGAGGHARLVLPEWHTGRPVSYPARLLPAASRVPGSWVRCTADLSQARAAALNIADVEPSADPGPEFSHRPAYTPAAPHVERPRPTVGAGCGDIVLELVGDLRDSFHLRGGLLDIYVIERPIGIHAGDRVYLAQRGWITSYLPVRAREPRPFGDFVRCEPQPRALARPIAITGRVEQHHWRWRWWERALERHGSDEQLAAIAAEHDPLEHNPDYVWTHHRPLVRRTGDAGGRGARQPTGEL